MAKAKAPLLSLGATGKFANTLVFFNWKGIKVAREYVVPSNPQTAAQTTQRNAFTVSVSAWRNFFTNALQRQAWNRAATAEGRAESGFNNSMRAQVKLVPIDPDASMVLSGVAAAGNLVALTLINMDDGAVGDEAGNFEVWVGDRPDSLLLFESVAIIAGVVTTTDLGDTADIKYVQLRKGGESRSGIGKYTLIA